MRRFAEVLSVIFHPLLMPLACTFIAFQFDWFVRGALIPEQISLIYLIVVLSTIIFPVVNILFLRWYGVISSLTMPIRKERTAPFISTLFFFALGYYMIRKGNLPQAVYSILFGAIIALIAVILINFKWKISAHAVGILGALGTTAGLFYIHSFGNIVLLSGVVLLGGLVLTSRLILKTHTPAQVYVGAILGFFALYLPVIYGIYI